MRRLSRRQFLRLTALSAAGVAAAEALAGCGILPPEVLSPEELAPRTSPQPEMLYNENVPGFYVRYYKRFPAPDPGQWRLTVDGLVRRPASLSLRDVQQLPSVTQVRRMKCVECWSARGKWEGFDLRSLMEVVDALPEARWVHFYCADDYYESMSIEELLQDGVVFAYRMNHELLPAKYGSPLRLVSAPKYGYKWPKAIVRLEFASEEKRGYWPTVGPYTSDGAILAGRDHPLDLPDGSRPVEGGEVLYPEDVEAQQALS